MDKQLVVLLAEDSAHDIAAAQRAWTTLALRTPLRVVMDGEECLDYLYQRGKYATPGSAPRPGLLLLDLRMPRLDGLGVLRHVRSDPDFRRLPIVVLTTSTAEMDKQASWELGANAYVIKPVGLQEFTESLRRIAQFWEMAETPS